MYESINIQKWSIRQYLRRNQILPLNSRETNKTTYDKPPDVQPWEVIS